MRDRKRNTGRSWQRLDVDYLAFMRNAHDARGRGLLPSFKRIAPLQPKGSDTAVTSPALFDAVTWYRIVNPMSSFVSA